MQQQYALSQLQYDKVITYSAHRTGLRLVYIKASTFRNHTVIVFNIHFPIFHAMYYFHRKVELLLL
jgi:hypothetical protein